MKEEKYPIIEPCALGLVGEAIRLLDRRLGNPNPTKCEKNMGKDYLEHLKSCERIVKKNISKDPRSFEDWLKHFGNEERTAKAICRVANIQTCPIQRKRRWF